MINSLCLCCVEPWWGVALWLGLSCVVAYLLKAAVVEFSLVAPPRNLASGQTLLHPAAGCHICHPASPRKCWNRFSALFCFCFSCVDIFQFPSFYLSAKFGLFRPVFRICWDWGVLIVEVSTAVVRLWGSIVVPSVVSNPAAEAKGCAHGADSLTCT